MKSSTFALAALLATSLLGHQTTSANQLVAGEELYELCSAKFSQLSSCLAADATNADDVDQVCCSLLDSFYKSGCLCPDCPEESRLTSFNNQGAPLLKRLQPLIDTCDEDGQLSVLLLTATWDLSGKSVSGGDIEEEEEDIIEDIIIQSNKDDAEDQYNFLADDEDYDDEEEEDAAIAAIDEALAIRNGIVGNEDFPVDVIDFDNDQIMVEAATGAAAMTNPNDNQRTVTHKVSLDLTLDGDVNHLDEMIDAIFDMAAKTGASAANQLVGNNDNVETVRLLKTQLDDQLTRAKDQLKETLQKSAATVMGRKAGAGNTSSSSSSSSSSTGSERTSTTTTTKTKTKAISDNNDNSDASSTISSSSSSAVSCNCDDIAIPDVDEDSSLVDHVKRVIAQGKRKLCKFACSNHTIIMWVVAIESVILALWAVVYIAATFVPQLQQQQQQQGGGGGGEKEQFIRSRASVLENDDEEEEREGQLQQPLLASIYKL